MTVKSVTFQHKLKTILQKMTYMTFDFEEKNSKASVLCAIPLKENSVSVFFGIHANTQLYRKRSKGISLRLAHTHTNSFWKMESEGGGNPLVSLRNTGEKRFPEQIYVRNTFAYLPFDCRWECFNLLVSSYS